MKKIICMISAFTLLTAAFSGCGKDKPKQPPVLDDGDGGFVIAETEPVTTLPKIKPSRTETEEETESNSSDETSNANNTVSGGDTSSDSNEGDVREPNNGSSENASDESKTTENRQDQSSAVQTGTVAEEVYYLEGIVYSVSDNAIMLKDPDIGWVRAGFDGKSALKNVNVGDKVLVKHDGEIKEAVPAVTNKTYGIEVTEKAPEECNLQRFECKNIDYNLSFSLLVPKSWNSKNIDYPTEGDFTDWGMRITPKDETRGLDISWHSSFAILEPYDITPIAVNGKDVDRYSKNGNWRFYVYDNDYIAANTFYNTSGYEEYTDDIEFMLETLEFEELPFNE